MQETLKHRAHYVGPVVVGGVVAGILSSIPLVNYCNAIFCMWNLVGSGLAVYLVMRRTGVHRIEPLEGAAIGALAGLVSGVIFGLLATLITAFFGLTGIAAALDGNSEAAQGAGFFVVLGLGFFFGGLVLYGAFGALGGVLGAVVTAKPAPPAPPAGGFGPPPGPGGFAPPGGGGFGPPGGGGFTPPPGPGGYGGPPHTF